MTMTGMQAREVERSAIVVGGYYRFYCEVVEEYKPAEQRLRRFSGQIVKVVKDEHSPTSGTGWGEDDSIFYRVLAMDGTEFTANMEELNGWDRDLGQFNGPAGEWGSLR